MHMEGHKKVLVSLDYSYKVWLFLTLGILYTMCVLVWGKPVVAVTELHLKTINYFLSTKRKICLGKKKNIL